MLGSAGPGAHSHETNEELFYVIEGTMTFLVGNQHVDATTGTFLRIPAGMTHDFENRTARPAGFSMSSFLVVSNPTWRRSSSGIAPKLTDDAFISVVIMRISSIGLLGMLVLAGAVDAQSRGSAGDETLRLSGE
jgi:hypothetical protein